MNKSGSSKISLNTSQYEQKFYGSPLSKNSNLDDTDELLRYKIGEDNPSIHSASRISGSFTRYRGGSKLSRYQSSPNYPSHYDESYQYPMNSNSQLSFSPNHFASNPVNRYDLASTPDSLRNTSLHGESALDNSVANPSLVYSHRGDDYSKNYSLEQKKHDEPIEAANGQASDTASTQQQTSDSLHDGFDSNSQDLHRFDHLDNEALVKRTQKLLDETLESYDKEAYVQGTQWSDQRYQGHASITTSHELKHRQKQNVSMEHDRSYSKPKITDSATNRSANYYPDHHKLSTNTSINIDYASPNDSIETADLGIREDMEVISNVSSIPMDADLLQSNRSVMPTSQLSSPRVEQAFDHDKVIASTLIQPHHPVKQEDKKEDHDVQHLPHDAAHHQQQDQANRPNIQVIDMTDKSSRPNQLSQEEIVADEDRIAQNQPRQKEAVVNGEALAQNQPRQSEVVMNDENLAQNQPRQQEITVDDETLAKNQQTQEEVIRIWRDITREGKLKRELSNNNIAEMENETSHDGKTINTEKKVKFSINDIKDDDDLKKTIISSEDSNQVQNSQHTQIDDDLDSSYNSQYGRRRRPSRSFRQRSLEIKRLELRETTHSEFRNHVQNLTESRKLSLPTELDMKLRMNTAVALRRRSNNVALPAEVEEKLKHLQRYPSIDFGDDLGIDEKLMRLFEDDTDSAEDVLISLGFSCADERFIPSRFGDSWFQHFQSPVIELSNSMLTDSPSETAIYSSNCREVTMEELVETMGDRISLYALPPDADDYDGSEESRIRSTSKLENKVKLNKWTRALSRLTKEKREEILRLTRSERTVARWHKAFHRLNKRKRREILSYYNPPKDTSLTPDGQTELNDHSSSLLKPSETGTQLKRAVSDTDIIRQIRSENYSMQLPSNLTLSQSDHGEMNLNPIPIKTLKSENQEEKNQLQKDTTPSTTSKIIHQENDQVNTETINDHQNNEHQHHRSSTRAKKENTVNIMDDKVDNNNNNNYNNIARLRSFTLDLGDGIDDDKDDAIALTRKRSASAHQKTKSKTARPKLSAIGKRRQLDFGSPKSIEEDQAVSSAKADISITNINFNPRPLLSNRSQSLAQNLLNDGRQLYKQPLDKPKNAEDDSIQSNSKSVPHSKDNPLVLDPLNSQESHQGDQISSLAIPDDNQTSSNSIHQQSNDRVDSIYNQNDRSEDKVPSSAVSDTATTMSHDDPNLPVLNPSWMEENIKDQDQVNQNRMTNHNDNNQCIDQINVIQASGNDQHLLHDNQVNRKDFKLNQQDGHDLPLFGNDSKIDQPVLNDDDDDVAVVVKDDRIANISLKSDSSQGSRKSPFSNSTWHSDSKNSCKDENNNLTDEQNKPLLHHESKPQEFIEMINHDGSNHHHDCKLNIQDSLNLTNVNRNPLIVKQVLTDPIRSNKSSNMSHDDIVDMENKPEMSGFNKGSPSRVDDCLLQKQQVQPLPPEQQQQMQDVVDVDERESQDFPNHNHGVKITSTTAQNTKQHASVLHSDLTSPLSPNRYMDDLVISNGDGVQEDSKLNQSGLVGHDRVSEHPSAQLDDYDSHPIKNQVTDSSRSGVLIPSYSPAANPYSRYSKQENSAFSSSYIPSSSIAGKSPGHSKYQWSKKDSASSSNGAQEDGSSEKASDILMLNNIRLDIKKATQEKDIVRRQLQVLQEAISQAKKELDSYQQQLKDYQRKINEASIDVTMLKEKKEVIQNQLEGAKQKLIHTEELLQDKEDRLSSLTRHQPTSTDNDDDDVKIAKEEVLQLKEEKDRLKRELRIAQSRPWKLDGGYSSLESNEVELNRYSQEEFAKEQARHAEIVDILKGELESQRKSNDEIRKKYSTLVQNMEHHNRVEDEIERHRLQIRLEYSQQEVDRLKEELQNYRCESKEENDTTKNLMKLNEQQIGRLERVIDDKDQTIAALSDEIEVLKQQNDEDCDRLKELISETQTIMVVKESEMESLKQQFVEKELAWEKEKELLTLSQQQAAEERLNKKLSELRKSHESEQQHCLSEQRLLFTAQLENKDSIIKVRENEIAHVRELLKKQEESTRALGEKLRAQAKEQIESAINKERENNEEDTKRQLNRELDAAANKFTTSLTLAKEDLSKERQKILILEQTIAQQKSEIQELYLEKEQLELDGNDRLLQTEENLRKKLDAQLEAARDQFQFEKERDIERIVDEMKKKHWKEITDLKTDNQNELKKLGREKSNVDKIDKLIMKEIEEECKECCQFLGLSKSWHSEETDNVSIQDRKINALANLRRCNEDLRQHMSNLQHKLASDNKLLEQARLEKISERQALERNFEIQKTKEFEAFREQLVRDHLEEITKLHHDVIRGKDEVELRRDLKEKELKIKEYEREMQSWKEKTSRGLKLKFQHEFDIEIERRMKEIQQQQNINLRVNVNNNEKHDSSHINNSYNSHPSANTSYISNTSSSTSPNTSRQESTAKLLRHLQGRVKELRQANEDLRRDGLVGSTNNSEVENREGSGEVVQLRNAIPLSEDKPQRSSILLNQKLEELNKMQVALQQKTKDHLALEHAYSALKEKIS